MDRGDSFPYGARVAVAWMPPGSEAPVAFATRILPADDGRIFVEPPVSGEAPPLMSDVQIVMEDGAYVLTCAAAFLGEDEEGWLCFKATGSVRRHPKRRFLRVPARLAVALPGVNAAQTVDVSGSGVLIEVGGVFPYECGDVVDGVLGLPGAPVEIAFRVVWRRETAEGLVVACEFLAIADEDREKVIDYMVSRQGGTVHSR